MVASVHEVFGLILSNAVGVAISPMPIIGMLLVLFSPKPVTNGLAFIVGWLVSTMGVVAIGMVTGVENTPTTSSRGGNVLQIAVGVLFLVLAFTTWRNRPRAGAEPATPSWMSSLDRASAVSVLGTALTIGTLNPKNIPLNLSTAASVRGGELTTADNLIVLLGYGLVASLTIIGPYVALLVARPKVAPALLKLKDALLQNNATIMTVLFLILGTNILGVGIASS